MRKTGMMIRIVGKTWLSRIQTVVAVRGPDRSRVSAYAAGTAMRMTMTVAPNAVCRLLSAERARPWSTSAVR
jgi:hypothetical protein